jgi:hypothetical protein
VSDKKQPKVNPRFSANHMALQGSKATEILFFAPVADLRADSTPPETMCLDKFSTDTQSMLGSASKRFLFIFWRARNGWLSW